jgi:hypothetical protein
VTTEGTVDRLTSDVVLVDDYWEWDRLVHERDWSDGLPVAPPTEARVGAIIEYLQRDPQEEIGTIPPQYGRATIEQVAIQCAMAGCIPEHAPVVIAAIEAMIDPEFNLHGVQCTTNPCAPLTIVSGPIVDDLQFNVRNGAFGGGGFANAAIGRAVRLILWNLGGGKPRINDMSPLGQPAKFTFCVAENLAQSPWAPIHTDFGFKPEDNAVTVFACSSPYPAASGGSAKMILDSLCEGLPSSTINMYNAAGQILVVLSIKPAVALAEAGYTKDDVRRYIFENARLSVRHLKECHLLDEPNSSSHYWGEATLRDVRQNPLDLPDDARLPMVVSPDDIMLMVTGGDGQWWAGFCIGWGAFGGYARSRPITLPG